MTIRNRTIALIATASLMAGMAATWTVMESPVAQAVSQVAINKYIRAHGGIPPCTYEDGSGQPGKCYWDASERGNGEGTDFVAVPTMPGHDKRIVSLGR